MNRYLLSWASVLVLGLASPAGAAPAPEAKRYIARQILRPDGQPLVGATVRVQRDAYASNTSGSKTRLEAVTDEHGKFRVEIPDKEGWQGCLFVLADGCAVTCETGVTATELSNLSAYPVISVRAAYKIAGKATGPDGRPLPNADIFLVGIHPDHWNYVALNTLEPAKVVTSELATRSDAGGRWTLPGVDVIESGDRFEEASFQFEAAAYGPTRIARASLNIDARERPKPGDTLPFDIQLTPPIKISGHVINAATGRPVQGAAVGCDNPFRRNSGDRTVTDASGRFELNLAGPLYALWFRVYYDGFVGVTLQTEQREKPVNDWRDTINLTVPIRPLVKVSGTLHDEAGQPLKEKVEITYSFEEKLEDTRWSLTVQNAGRDTRIAPDGRFSAMLPTGRLTLHLERTPSPSSPAGMVAGEAATHYKLEQKVVIPPGGQSGLKLKAKKIQGKQ